MFEDYEVVHLNLNNQNTYQQWQALLSKEALSDLSKTHAQELDFSIGFYHEDNLIATASSQDSIIKYVAIQEQHRSDGKLFNKMISYLINYLATAGIFHLFVFTKPAYSQSFSYLGFKELACTEKGCLLETGDQTITDFLAGISKMQGSLIGAIVMNANPFTKGHRYLIETAASQCDAVYVFVVSADRSLFTTKERFELVQKNTADLTNVLVLEGGDYQVSPVTFPTYFLKTADDATIFQTELDAALFKKWFVPALGITTRFLGEEPFSPTTKIYNDNLQKILGNQLKVVVIPRKETPDQQIISATTVRKLIKENKLEQVEKFVTPITLDFIQSHQQTLRDRMESEEEINHGN